MRTSNFRSMVIVAALSTSALVACGPSGKVDMSQHLNNQQTQCQPNQNQQDCKTQNTTRSGGYVPSSNAGAAAAAAATSQNNQNANAAKPAPSNGGFFSWFKGSSASSGHSGGSSQGHASPGFGHAAGHASGGG